jgi:lipopolysaccharide transport system permease protein
MSSSEEEWDLIIEPNSKTLDLQLGNIWRYRDLIFLLIRRDFVAFYKQTVLGPIWFFVQPIASTITYSVIFGNLAGLGTDGVPAPLFYLAGIISWNYFSDCLLKTSTVFRDNSNLFGKVYFPRLILPISIVISNLIRFAVQFLLFILMLIFYYFKTGHVLFSVDIIFYPLLIVLMAAQGLGFGLIVTAFTTKYRDLVMLLSFAIQLFMYSTTVVYPLSTLKGNLHTIVSLNPMTPIIEGSRRFLLGHGEISFFSLSYAFIFTFIILFIGLITFNRSQKNFVDTI